MNGIGSEARKARLDVAVHHAGSHRGYEQAVRDVLYDAGMPVVRATECQERDLARAVGQLTTTDRRDAAVRACMTQPLDLQRYPPIVPWQPRLGELAQAQRQRCR